MVGFLRSNVYATFLLTAIRLYLGVTWIQAGWHKVTSSFTAQKFLVGAVQKSAGDFPSVQGWWAWFLKNVAIPHVDVFDFLVSWGELLVGIGLIVGLFTTFASLMAIMMNFAYLFSGTTSLNPPMILLTIFLLVAGFNAGRWGLDRWVIPALFIRHKQGVPGVKRTI
ncbi:thiosulfate dehydrogenase [quinone] large subunit [Croceifilum oryzae]|uniref:Thiosulfate dehydrogenase [quinone] large subunit n=1 Tax=Croceifilum oryzae TaxID=1553429 RepID=A0AAJ1TI12_9BACL|nr:DoxX family protein [Croceifilum oryzae]MDQ0418874.1 thiosulfate dehydrogenase [quinone] large subunit [Croceifilum oryzae]